VGQKRQRERRRAQLQRAAAAGDVADLRRRLSQNWRATAGQLASLFDGIEEPTAELLTLAEEGVGALRRDGALDAAVKLVRAAGPRTRLLRIEQALLAFARGDDAELRASAGSRPEVDRALAALAALTLGGQPKPAAKGSPAGVRALTGLSRMVAAAASRDRGGITRASREVPEELRGRLFFDAIHAACSLAALGVRERGASELAKTVGRSSLVLGVASRERALADLLADAAPATVDKGALASVAAANEARKKRAAAAIREHRGEGADPMAAALHAARSVGEAAFADPAAGALMVGFSRLGEHDLDGALRSFDAAIAGGADLVEALRGRWLALSLRSTRSRDSDTRQAADAGAAAERLAHALKTRPGASPYAVLAAVSASHMFAMAGDHAGVLRAGALARSCDGSGTLAPAIAAELEVHALREGLARPDEALAKRLAEITASVPGIVDAWALRLDLAVKTGAPTQEVDTLILEAFEKTGDRVFAADARLVARHRAENVPPSAAAQIVRDVMGRIEDGSGEIISPDGLLDAALGARLSELQPPARHATYAALLVELGMAGLWSELDSFFARVARGASPVELGELLLAVAHIPTDDTEGRLVKQLRTLAAAGLAHPDALPYAFAAALVMGHETAAQVALSLLAPHVASSNLRRMQQVVRQMHRSVPPQVDVDRCETVIDALDEDLQPGYSLRDAVYVDADDEDDLSLEALGGVQEMIEKLSSSERTKLIDRMSRIAAGGAPSPRGVQEIMRMIGSKPGSAARRPG
jgi:hypothetical protein